jgi:hypothetical protein
VIALLALAAAATAPMSALDAERAFASDAQKLGQLTAFRKWSAANAVMFAPGPVNAQAFLKARKDPPASLYWWPGRSYLSCRGNYAINTGSWVGGWGKSTGYFTTVWQRQSDGGWKWLYDAGDALGAVRPEGGDIGQKTASCEGTPSSLADAPTAEGAVTGSGASPDGSLRLSWIYLPDGTRSFRAFLWNGSTYEQVIADDVTAND